MKDSESVGSDREFYTLFNELPDAIIVLDSHGILLECNKKSEELTGFNKKELLGKNVLISRILGIKSKALVIKNLALRFAGVDVPPFEIEIFRNDGKAIPVEICAKIIDYKGGKADVIVIRDITERKTFLRDITERKRMEDELKRVNDELKSKVEELEKITNLAVGRELKMVELKNRIEELEKQLQTNPQKT